MKPVRQKLRIGELLVQNNELTEKQLQEALAEQKGSGLKLGRILIERGYIDEDRFLHFLSEQCEVPFYDLRQFKVDTDLVGLLPETQARRYRAIVLEEKDGELIVGMSDPLDLFAYDEIVNLLKRPVGVGVVRESELMHTIDVAYRRTGDIMNFASELHQELGGDTQLSPVGFDSVEDDDNTPVARLLRTILEDAVQTRTSDVHIEPDEDLLRIRQRIDGVLHEQTLNEATIASALVSRLKLMAGLNISERRLPQDGRFDIQVNTQEFDVRLSTMPVRHGESVVMRIADHSGAASSLDQVGLPAEMLERFRFLVTRPNGLVLVTGPTGSGKTTTLYGALNELNTAEKKIITAEDPVEYELPRVNQVQVNAKIGLDFATVLRACLRQDPDVLLVGEIRDLETAEIALRASMTGHLVLSTLHTNDAIASATRLLDIGVDGYLVASTLRGVLAQRLVRKVCEHCKQKANPDDQQFAWLDALVGHARAHTLEFYEGEGCNRCNSMGYHGRLGVFELLELNETLAGMLRANDTAEFTKAAQSHGGYKPLVLNALDLAIEGLTTLDEVLALSGQVEDLKAQAGILLGNAENSASRPAAH